MITVRFFRDKDNYIKKYIVNGHAKYDEYGRDIVCAAVSVLAQTALMSLVDVCGLKEESIRYNIDEERGFLSVELPNDIEISKLKDTQTVLETLFIGIKSVAEGYPEYVKLENRRCEWWLSWICNYSLLKKE